MKLKDLLESVPDSFETKSEARDYVIHKLGIDKLVEQIYDFSLEDKIGEQVWDKAHKEIKSRRAEEEPAETDEDGNLFDDDYAGQLCNVLWRDPIEDASWGVHAADNILVRGGHEQLVASLSESEREKLSGGLHEWTVANLLRLL